MKLILLLFFFSINAHAFEWSEASLGVGIYRYDNIRPNNQKAFLKKDPVYEPIPIFQFRLGPFFINKDGAGVALLYFEKVKLLAFALHEGEPYRTTGMEERKKSFHLGTGVKVFDFEALYYQDIQSRSRGKILKLIYAPVFNFKNYSFSPRLYTQFWSQKYVDYYFGVRDNEIDRTIGRIQYVGKKATNYGFMFRNIWKSGDLKYVLTAGYKFFDSSVYHSPTVVKKNEQRILAGIMYQIY